MIARILRPTITAPLRSRLDTTNTRRGFVSIDYYTVWPYVKNLVPHQSIYSWGRMQEVWLDK
jgi:hypothetical protein